ncbi:MAG: hypothetical protein PHD06_04405 [Bacteroidales bacterium]|jgi:hypothetical protein|nr:hypothetical protein [Bacteroidales bacterium]MDY0197771.1 hypothetical protein [Tenuifilaceae bacterium]
MKKKVLTLAVIALLGLSSLVTFGKEVIKDSKPTGEVGHLCCHNFDGVCDYGDGVTFDGAFWV